MQGAIAKAIAPMRSIALLLRASRRDPGVGQLASALPGMLRITAFCRAGLLRRERMSDLAVLAVAGHARRPRHVCTRQAASMQLGLRQS